MYYLVVWYWLNYLVELMGGERNWGIGLFIYILYLSGVCVVTYPNPKSGE